MCPVSALEAIESCRSGLSMRASEFNAELAVHASSLVGLTGSGPNPERPMPIGDKTWRGRSLSQRCSVSTATWPGSRSLLPMLLR